MQRIPQTAQAVKSNPYAMVIIPAIGRVWQALCDLAERAESRTIQISIRRLAAAAGLSSAGQIPGLLRQIAADGRIAYDPASSIVMLADQSADRLPSDQTGDRVCTPQGAGGVSGCDPDLASDQCRDRVKTRCKEETQIQTQEEESESSAPRDSVGDRALFARLVQHPGMNYHLACQISRNPRGSVEEFTRQLQIAQATPGIHNPFFFTVARWRDGQAVSPPEPPHAPEPNRDVRSRNGGAYRPGPRNRQSAPDTGWLDTATTGRFTDPFAHVWEAELAQYGPPPDLDRSA